MNLVELGLVMVYDGGICGLGLVVDRRMYMAAVRNRLVVVVYGRNDDDGARRHDNL